MSDLIEGYGYNSWDRNSNLEDDMVRVIEFEFVTNLGAGSVTTIVNKGVTIDQAKIILLDEITEIGPEYETIEIVSHKIIEILDDGSDAPKH